MNGPNRELFAHLANALARYSRELKRDGIRTPDGLLELLVFFADCASVRQGATAVGDPASPGDGERMNSLLLTKREAAAELRISVRQLERVLGKPGSGLTAVRIDGSVRIRRAELDSYVAALGRPTSFRDDIESKDSA